jgi:hypothetical protein
MDVFREFFGGLGKHIDLLEDCFVRPTRTVFSARVRQEISKAYASYHQTMTEPERWGPPKRGSHPK